MSPRDPKRPPGFGGGRGDGPPVLVHPITPPRSSGAPPRGAPPPRLPDRDSPIPVESPPSQAGTRAQTRRLQRAKRKTRVEQYREKDAGLRFRRPDNRLQPIENSLLGRPLPQDDSLPNFIGERWNRGGNQSIDTSTQTTLQYGTSNFTTEQQGFSPIYDDATFTWTIPPGLGGVWQLTGVVRWNGNASGHRNVEVELNGGTIIYAYRNEPAGSNELSQPIGLHWLFEEGDYFTVEVTQNSGGALAVLGGQEDTFLTAEFKGVIS